MIMKYIVKISLLAMIVLSLAYCKKDDEANASLAGQWKMTDIHADDGVSTFELLGTTLTGTYKFHGTEYNAVTTFTENPNEFTSTGSYTVEFISEFLGQSDTTIQVVDAFQGSGEWSISNDTLYQTFADSTTAALILELTGNKMRLRQDLDVTIIDNGTPIQNQATVFSTFERI
jgi:hypothetical protein